MDISILDPIRKCFRTLPSPLRSFFRKVYYFLLQRFYLKPQPGDFNWSKFRDIVLNEHQYRAVIIFEYTIPWNAKLFQRPQQMALALGRVGCLVIYRTFNDNLAVCFRQIAHNVWLAGGSAADRIPNAVRCFYSTAYVTTPRQIYLSSKRGRLLYEYIDHIDASISDASFLLHLQRIKKLAFQSADVIVSSAVILHEEALAHSKTKHCALIPNGVDNAHFRNAPPLTDCPEPLSGFRKKYQCIVGYFGALAPWLWYEAIGQVSALMPDVGFVFIGPDYNDALRRLPQSQNVLYLGVIDYAVLPSYARLFDVCFIPFRPGDVARSTSPLKLFEYFALEKPVVVTADMRECVVFPEVFSGNDAAELVAAIHQAFAVHKDEVYCAKLRALADASSWHVRAEQYLAALES